MDCSTPGLPVLHHLPEFAQAHLHWVNDAIQSSHPLLSSSLVLNLSQHQGLLQTVFSSGGRSTGVSASALVLPMNIQGWLPLELTGLILLSRGLSSTFSSTKIWKCQFFGIQRSLWSNSHPHMTTGKTTALTRWTFVGMMSLLFIVPSYLFFQGAFFNFVAVVTVCSDFGAQAFNQY